ncbi:hypothetical protein A8C32_16470 [Flavivirga aquatica]|uniref:PA14 domain-containing protein n=1 Tax=Flavivirga aquatica TaxID=1849968 RepID=A0A1E5T9N2_9FLAO|nr:hypothetical protein [Flavivirga aquatica]OEK08048.1 hypothetical protein A8C32_16470 [Flavivirga aquatica]
MKNIRTSKISKVIACYLAIQLVLTTVQPSNLFALTGGPSQPEFNSFTPIGTSDMVNLSTGDFNYNIPIMDVGGYPLNLAYDSGITMDQEASWVGLGWNLNIGQIARSVRGIPDDFKGDKMIYEKDLKDNLTIGVMGQLNLALIGKDTPKGEASGGGGDDKLKIKPSIGIGSSVEYNNYTGIKSSFSLGANVQMGEHVKVGVNLTSTNTEGVSISPSISYGNKLKDIDGFSRQLSTSVGVSYNTRQGLSAVSLSSSLRHSKKNTAKTANTKKEENRSNGGVGTYISFASPTYTPTKRAAMTNKSFKFSAAFGVEIYTLEPQLQLTGYGTKQAITEPLQIHKSYGYNNTHLATLLDIIDFNREKERSVSMNTNILPITNYTYDLYAIQGQGIGGQFRPYRSQVGYVFDKQIVDNGTGGSLGLEFGPGNLIHGGIDVKINTSHSSTGAWHSNNIAKQLNFEEALTNNNIDYEPVYYKAIGELNVDEESLGFLNNQLAGERPISLGLGGSSYNRSTVPNRYFSKGLSDTSTPAQSFINNKIKRNHRESRNQAIQQISVKEAKYDPFVVYRGEEPQLQGNANVKRPIDHHIAGIKVTQPQGGTYIYGQAVYNLKKVEATVDVSGIGNISNEDYENGLITCNNRNGKSNSRSDKYIDRVTTPSYAHSYLLTGVVSSDYEDLTEDGLTDDDLGAYTKFSYTKATPENAPYKWRVPYGNNKLTYNRGFNALEGDQKGNYIYGEKELVYIEKIETKTHVAFFELEDREDGRGAVSENLGKNQSTAGVTKYIKSITLYSKPEYEADPSTAVPIKKAHFIYDYSLCPGVRNNLKGGGKLTLKKVFFTYANSEMGRYTPYEFNYEGANPSYNIKSYDIWGNYKPFTTEANPNYSVTGSLTAPEFPYVSQRDREAQDLNASSWTLTSINLPSGGKIEMDYESDSYGYVQDKKAMRLFNVVGVGNESDVNVSSNLENAIGNDRLYSRSGDAKYLIIELDEQDKNQDITPENFQKKYIGEYIEKSIQFKFLLNMTDDVNESDYVSGYLEIDKNRSIYTSNNYAAIPMAFRDIEGIKDVNPISRSGWYFGRRYMNRIVFGGEEKTGDIISIAKDLVGSMANVIDLFRGPNKTLRAKKIASKFVPHKSWIRLLNPGLEKLGGGIRVKTLRMHDNWEQMTGHDSDNNYKQHYGQHYSYNLKDGVTTSGVATFEPNASKENPLVQPVHDEGERLLAPSEENYVESPIGESFFPSSVVTYSRVTVKSITDQALYEDPNSSKTIRNHASGSVVNTFYTSRDFPTITDNTKIYKRYKRANALGNFLKIKVREHLAASQGFVVVTNNMNGKLKTQEVYPEYRGDFKDIDKHEPISMVKYNYNVDEIDAKKLNNVLETVNSQGEISKRLIGVDYDVVNDFKEYNSSVLTVGNNGNIASFLALVAPVFIPSLFFEASSTENILRIATTTKVIHKRGVLKEKVAYDLGARVSTENLAWDAKTGQVLLTKTANEYDNSYYNFTYPAHWYYKGMGQATKNLGIEGYLEPRDDNEFFSVKAKGDSNFLTGDLPFYPGDMLHTYYGEAVKNEEKDETKYETLWVVEIEGDKVKLMDKGGNIINHECSPFIKGGLVEFKIIRSGYKNTQTASMASVTSQTNPMIDTNNDGKLDKLSNPNSGVVNASAIRYRQYWKPQDQLGLPRLSLNVEEEFIKESEFKEPNVDVATYGFNPYLYNVLGEWRAVDSYAFLTGRTSAVVNKGDTPNLEKDGYFPKFYPFYKLNGNEWELFKIFNWRKASTVTQYSPYGAELENKDALGRYSSALYGYAYTLPTAVASNSEYKETAFEGFEDSNYNNKLNRTSALIDEINYDTNEITYFNRDHFSLNKLTESTKSNGEISKDEAHTGKSSYKITGDKVEVTKGLIATNHTIPNYSCKVSDTEVDVKAIDVQEHSVINNPTSSNSSTIIYPITITGEEGETVPVHVWSKLGVVLSSADFFLIHKKTDGSSSILYSSFAVGFGSGSEFIEDAKETTVILDSQGKADIEVKMFYSLQEFEIQSNIAIDYGVDFLDSLGRERAPSITRRITK